MRYLAVVLGLVVLSGCEKNVEIDDPYPTEAEYCLVEDGLVGEWISDSVFIETDVDTIDTLIIEHGPTVVYYLSVSCGNSENKSLILRYYNYAGVETVDIDSKNFAAENGTIWIFSPLDSTRSRDEADGLIQYSLLNGELHLQFSEEPNSGQVTNYSLFLSPLTDG